MKKTYTILVWETEECRDYGISIEVDEFKNLKKCIEESRYYINDNRCVEVIDENGECYFHLSYKNNKIFEKYNKGKILNN